RPAIVSTRNIVRLIPNTVHNNRRYAGLSALSALFEMQQALLIWISSSFQATGYSDYRVKEMQLAKPLTIGTLASQTGVKVVTIRYYEQIGLMPSAARTDGNYRTYTAAHRRRLRFIRRCRDLGFTLDQIRDLLRLSSERTRACTE